MKQIRRKINATSEGEQAGFELSGWFDGRRTYLWFGLTKGPCFGTLAGTRLYQLAKSIIRQFEADRDETHHR